MGRRAHRDRLRTRQAGRRSTHGRQTASRCSAHPPCRWASSRGFLHEAGCAVHHRSCPEHSPCPDRIRRHQRRQTERHRPALQPVSPSTVLLSCCPLSLARMIAHPPVQQFRFYTFVFLRTRHSDGVMPTMRLKLVAKCWADGNPSLSAILAMEFEGISSSRLAASMRQDSTKA